MNSTMTSVDWPGVISSIIASLIVIVCGWILQSARLRLEGTYPYLRRWVLVLLSTAVVVANVVAFYGLERNYLWFFAATVPPLYVVWFLELNRFWRVGLIGTDRTVGGGIDYRRSLRLCTNSIDFLGVGAAKLTEQGSEFEEAIFRCQRPARPIRFLLCDPNSPRLAVIAKQAGRPDDTYRKTVIASLRVLAKLKNDRAQNIEVRFYSDLPLFRLFFINDILCLASQYVFGEGDGSQLPQLHVVRPVVALRDVVSLYHPFREYFEQLWAVSTPWDFHSNLEG